MTRVHDRDRDGRGLAQPRPRYFSTSMTLLECRRSITPSRRASVGFSASVGLGRSSDSRRSERTAQSLAYAGGFSLRSRMNSAWRYCASATRARARAKSMKRLAIWKAMDTYAMKKGWAARQTFVTGNERNRTRRASEHHGVVRIFGGRQRSSCRPAARRCRLPSDSSSRLHVLLRLRAYDLAARISPSRSIVSSAMRSSFESFDSRQTAPGEARYRRRRSSSVYRRARKASNAGELMRLRRAARADSALSPARRGWHRVQPL